MSEQNYDLIIRNGDVVDGTGSDAFKADIGVRGDSIAAVGVVEGSAGRELDATGLLVTPGFIDSHSHLDGSVTWEHQLKPNSGHGVTTTVMGNCGVGFAPCRPEHRAFTIALMEGVEDIPAQVLEEGLPWEWESFIEYRRFVAGRNFDMNVTGLLPHSCLRVYVMGQRAIDGEVATERDIEEMSELTCEAMLDGAAGVGSTRLVGQKTRSGIPCPSMAATEAEYLGIARGMQRAGRGVMQIAPEFNQYPLAEEELETMIRVARESGRPLTYSLKQTNAHTEGWKRLLEITRRALDDGVDVRPMVLGRPTGAIFGWECSVHRFVQSPTYKGIAHLPLGERIVELARPELRASILEETQTAELSNSGYAGVYRLLYVIGETPDYEPQPKDSIASMAERQGVHATELIYDAMMRDSGRGVLLLASGNYADGSLEPAREMMEFDTAVLGLGDAGAHCTIICDASATTYMLSYWARDRTLGAKLPLPFVVKRLTFDSADLFGLADRGVIKVGMKADINVIDHARLNLRPPRMEYDLPAGGRRLVQDATGYIATIVNGVPVCWDGKATDALPGRLI